MLDEFYVESFIHPVYGMFQHLLGLKCYLRTGCKDDSYRWMDPADVLERFSNAKKQWHKNYMYNVRLAYLAKVSQSEDLAKALHVTTLPLERYRVDVDDDGNVIIESKERDQLTINMWESMRDHLRTSPTSAHDEMLEILSKIGFLKTS